MKKLVVIIGTVLFLFSCHKKDSKIVDILCSHTWTKSINAVVVSITAYSSYTRDGHVYIATKASGTNCETLLDTVFSTTYTVSDRKLSIVIPDSIADVAKVIINSYGLGQSATIRRINDRYMLLETNGKGGKIEACGAKKSFY